MKGVVFTEFLELVENNFGLDVADSIIEGAQLSTDGAYTAVGTYDHHELLQLVSGLSAETNTPVPALVRTFGGYLFGRFVAGYPECLDGVDSAFDFLANVEGYIHAEVRKLYPDAELPSFEYGDLGPKQLEMTYRSSRPFADLAEGLIEACIKHFGEQIDIERDDLDEKNGTVARFRLTVREGVTVCGS